MGVYIVQGENLVKIGFTERSAESRLRNLQTSCPFPLKLLYFDSTASREDERILHSLLHVHREHGEWFRIEGEVKYSLDTIAELGRSRADFLQGLQRGRRIWRTLLRRGCR